MAFKYMKIGQDWTSDEKSLEFKKAHDELSTRVSRAFATSTDSSKNSLWDDTQSSWDLLKPFVGLISPLLQPQTITDLGDQIKRVKRSDILSVLKSLSAAKFSCPDNLSENKIEQLAVSCAEKIKLPGSCSLVSRLLLWIMYPDMVTALIDDCQCNLFYDWLLNSNQIQALQSESVTQNETDADELWIRHNLNICSFLPADDPNRQQSRAAVLFRAIELFLYRTPHHIAVTAVTSPLPEHVTQEIRQHHASFIANHRLDSYQANKTLYDFEHAITHITGNNLHEELFNKVKALSEPYVDAYNALRPFFQPDESWENKPLKEHYVKLHEAKGDESSSPQLNELLQSFRPVIAEPLSAMFPPHWLIIHDTDHQATAALLRELTPFLTHTGISGAFTLYPGKHDDILEHFRKMDNRDYFFWPPYLYLVIITDAPWLQLPPCFSFMEPQNDIKIPSEAGAEQALTSKLQSLNSEILRHPALGPAWFFADWDLIPVLRDLHTSDPTSELWHRLLRPRLTTALSSGLITPSDLSFFHQIICQRA